MSSKQTRAADSRRLTPHGDTSSQVPGPQPRPTPADELDPQLVVSFVSLAVCHSDRNVHCGLTIVPVGRVAQTIGATDDVPVRADWLQNQQRQGPAIGRRRGRMITSLDLADDPRWPDFGRLCVATLDVRSMLAVDAPMAGPGRAVLTFYSPEPDAIGRIDLDAVATLAPMVGSSALAALNRSTDALRAASDVDYSRTAVALAIVMSHQALSPAQAFSRLRDASRRSGRPLVEVALDVLAAGQLPGDPAVAEVAAGRHRFIGGPDMWCHPRSGPAA